MRKPTRRRILDGGSADDEFKPPLPNTPAAWMRGSLDLDQLLGPIPLIMGEDPDACAKLHGRLIEAFEPTSASERGLVRDLHFWGLQEDRYGRWRRELWPDLQAQGVLLALRDVLGAEAAASLAFGGVSGDPVARRQMERELARRGLTLAQATAVAAATPSALADYNAAVRSAARECLDQSNRVWRRLEQSRSWQAKAQRVVSQQFRRQRAEAEKVRREAVEGLRASLMKGYAVHPAALQPWTPPSAEPVNAEAQNGLRGERTLNNEFHFIPAPTFERPDWISPYAQLMDDFPSIGGLGDRGREDTEYVYYLHLLSLYPEDVLQERLVRSAVQARLDLHELQGEFAEVVGAALAMTLHATLHNLAPDADPALLLAQFRSEPAVRTEVGERLGSAGLTFAYVEARGVWRNMKQLTTLQRRLIRAQDRILAVDKAFTERRVSGMRRRNSPDGVQERCGRRDW